MVEDEARGSGEVNKPGIYFDVPFDEYLRWPHLSQSTLKAGRKSMAHLKARMDDRSTVKVTDAMTLGSALHCAFLEPEVAASKVVCYDGGVRRGKVWEAFYGRHLGKIILTPLMHKHLTGMMRSLRAHPQIREWADRIEATEVSAVGQVCGVTMKGRVDALTVDPLVDLKVISQPDRFAYQVYDLGYHIQAAVYTHLFGRDRFMLAAVESKPPYDVVVHELSADYIAEGRQEAMGLLQRYKKCMETGEWPGVCQDVLTLDKPEWLKEHKPRI